MVRQRMQGAVVQAFALNTNLTEIGLLLMAWSKFTFGTQPFIHGNELLLLSADAFISSAQWLIYCFASLGFGRSSRSSVWWQCYLVPNISQLSRGSASSSTPRPLLN